MIIKVRAGVQAFGKGSKGCTEKKNGVCLIFPLRDAPLGSLSGKQETSGLGLWGTRVSCPHTTAPSTQFGAGREVGGDAPTPWVLHPRAHRAGLQTIGATSRCPNEKAKMKPKWQLHHLLIRHHVLRLRLNKKPSVSRLEGNLTHMQIENKVKSNLGDLLLREKEGERVTGPWLGKEKEISSLAPAGASR